MDDDGAGRARRGGSRGRRAPGAGGATGDEPPDVREVFVVGAGIVGASIAYHAARAGARVTLLDKGLPASGVTGDSFAWIGGPSGDDAADASTALRRHVLGDWRRLEAELPGVHVRRHGSLVWGDDPPRVLAPGEAVVDAPRIAHLEPALRTAPPSALHKTTDGAVDPVAVTEALVQGARDSGAEVRAGVAVTAVRLDEDRVTGVVTTQGVLDADAVVLAAGVETSVLCTSLGVDLPVAPSPALLIRFTAPAELVRTLVSSDGVEARQTEDGLVLVADTYEGEVSRSDLERRAEAARGRLADTFAVDADDVRLVSVRVGMRPMPVDGLPIVGPVPGIDGAYLAVMHSGVTLAPTVGRLVAQELVHDADVDELAGLRPARFSGS